MYGNVNKNIVKKKKNNNALVVTYFLSVHLETIFLYHL